MRQVLAALDALHEVWVMCTQPCMREIKQLRIVGLATHSERDEGMSRSVCV